MQLKFILFTIQNFLLYLPSSSKLQFNAVSITINLIEIQLKNKTEISRFFGKLFIGLNKSF